MLTLLERPLPPSRLLLALLALELATALYCLAYSTLAGQPEPPVEAIAWAAANVLPWLLALEACKRWTASPLRVAALAGAFAASMLAGQSLQGDGGGLWFEALRRAPGLIAVVALLAILSRSSAAPPSDPESDERLPLPPEAIDWVRAAGNYVEIRSGRRILVHRASLAAAERRLAPAGFVRIHRSLLVRRDRIARVRPYDVVLADGTHLKTGRRYRSALDG